MTDALVRSDIRPRRCAGRRAAERLGLEPGCGTAAATARLRLRLGAVDHASAPGCAWDGGSSAARSARLTLHHARCDPELADGEVVVGLDRDRRRGEQLVLLPPRVLRRGTPGARRARTPRTPRTGRGRRREVDRVLVRDVDARDGDRAVVVHLLRQLARELDRLDVGSEGTAEHALEERLDLLLDCAQNGQLDRRLGGALRKRFSARARGRERQRARARSPACARRQRASPTQVAHVAARAGTGLRVRRGEHRRADRRGAVDRDRPDAPAPRANGRTAAAAAMRAAPRARPRDGRSARGGRRRTRSAGCAAPSSPSESIRPAANGSGASARPATSAAVEHGRRRLQRRAGSRAPAGAPAEGSRAGSSGASSGPSDEREGRCAARAKTRANQAAAATAVEEREPHGVVPEREHRHGEREGEPDRGAEER